MAVAVRQNDGSLQTEDQVRDIWKPRIDRARQAQKPFVPIWLSNLAFAAGQHWLVWDPHSNGGRLRHIAEMDPRYENRNLLTADRINEYRQAQLGELDSDDDRQQFLTVQQSDTAEKSAKELNQAVAYAWEHEWDAESALDQVRQYCVDLGTAAIRCRWDPNHGKVINHTPIQNGQSVTDPAELQSLEQNGTLQDGSLPQYKEVREGRTIWEPYTSFQILSPPGVHHEARFPWEILVRPVSIDSVTDEYPDAGDLTEDTDIASAMGLSTGQIVRDRRSQGAASESRLRGHVWLYTCFQRPNREHPKGQVVVLASNQLKVLDVRQECDYQLPNGDYHAGVVYFHWWRLIDRFYSRAFIEPMKDPQREINNLKTFGSEIIARGGPKVFLREQDLIENPQGLPMELIRMKDSSQQPYFFQGIGPGTWMEVARAESESDIGHASTMSALALGENPQNVDTYSQLALLNENETGKRSVINTGHKRSIATLEELGVYDIRKYWPDEKLVMVAGDEDSLAQQTFKKASIPDFYMVKVAKGAPQPRSQAAELKKIDAIWAAAVQSGLAGHDPASWTSWFTESINAGVAQEIPEGGTNSQQQLAAYENLLMKHGEAPPVSEYDLAPSHVPVHREGQDHARAANDLETFARIQQHILDHVEKAPLARKAWRIIDPADTQDVASDLALDEQQALRENEMLVQGLPLNPEELQQALGAVKQGINPETGQKLDPKDVKQAILLRAALKPTLVENLEVHLDRHGKVIKSAEFQQFPEEVRQRFLTHFDETRQLYLSLPMLPAEVVAPHVTLALRESVGPSTIAQILRRAGVPEGDPQLLAGEEPMENMVQRTDPPATNPPKPASSGPKPPL